MLLIHVLAQAAVAAAPAESAAQPDVVSYAPAFFAAQQPGTALDMINRIPGFSLDEGASVRGFEGAAGNVLIDGRRPASKSDGLEEILRRVPASRVARIDIIRGGAPGIDMQGKTVLANIVRTSGGGVRGLVELKDFAVDDGRHSGGVRLEATGGSERPWEVSLRGTKFIANGGADGPGRRMFGSGAPDRPYYINGEGDEVQYVATGAYATPLLDGRLRLNGRLSSNKYKADEVSQFFDPAPGVERQDDGQLEKETEIGGAFGREIGADLSAEVIALRQTNDTDVSSRFFDGTDRKDFARSGESVETIGRLVVKRRFGDRLSFELGGETAVNTLDSTTGFAVNGAAVVLPAADVSVKEKRSEGFLKGSWRPLDEWTFDAGLRYETSTIASKGDVALRKSLRYAKPRLAVTWAPSTTTQLRLRGEREVGQLDFTDFVAKADLNTSGAVFAGNPDIDPQQAWVAEAALEQRFWTSGSVVLTARHYELSDVIDRAPIRDPSGRVFDAPANIGDGTKDELQFELTLPTDRFGLARGQIKGKVRRGWTSVIDPTTRRARGISGYRPVDWEVFFTQDVPRWDLTWGVEVYGSLRERYYRFDLIEDVKQSSLVRPYVEYRPRPDLNIRVEVFNATRRAFRDYITEYPGPRDAGGAPDVQSRVQTNTPYGLLVRLRKTLGG